MPALPLIGLLGGAVGGGSLLLGGAGYLAGKAIQKATQSSPGTASVPETVPGAVPPSSPNSAEVTAAQQDYLRQAYLKKSIRRTTVAGETGGFSPNTNPLKPGTPMPAGARG